MPEIFSILIAALILAALFKLFFDDLEDFKANAKKFCWWLTVSEILNLPPETYERGWRFLIRLSIGAAVGALLYIKLSN
ncbi:MAG TPA: hypothetical protein VF721_02995 [Pyrinomonadaceae bacterium]|jgi:hypothetical protein